MRILGIETSCDETSTAIIEADRNDKNVKLLSNIVSSSLILHSKTGGIIPEIAAREQLKYIIPAIEKTLLETRGSTPGVDAQNPASFIDAIAVTVGPGLIGSLLVGVETAKTLAYAWDKPIIPVNHLIGHIYANWMDTQLSNSNSSVDQLTGKPKTGKLLSENRKPKTGNWIAFPALALIISGGHTDLVLLKKHGSIKWLGGTRDDAAGEAFDKIGRLLGLAYPAGPLIEKLAKNGNPKRFRFPRPMIDSNDFDFSFSGLKTAVLREIKTMKQLNNEVITDISASVQQAIIDVLVKKTLKAAKQHNVKSILLSGGVAANQVLRDRLRLEIGNWKLEIPFFFPEKWLCTDNAAMIASAAFFNYAPKNWKQIIANPELYFY